MLPILECQKVGRHLLKSVYERPWQEAPLRPTEEKLVSPTMLLTQAGYTHLTQDPKPVDVAQ